MKELTKILTNKKDQRLRSNRLERIAELWREKEMKLPNKNAININVEMVPFKKFAEKEGYYYNEETIRIEGTFREKDTGEIVKGDIFDAHLLSGQNIENIYKVYLDWFNYTRNPYEKEREFVAAKRAKVSG